MSLQAYQQASERAEHPRDSEYRLFGEVTRALMDAAQLPSDAFVQRIKALDWNRRVWMTLAADCARTNNSLPAELRAQIISLSMWVGRHTNAVVRQEEPIEPLIEINRIMMQGLGVRSPRQVPTGAG
ncbi:MAG TPA: flagellar biosynthesis regulator FlaF [Caulobacteraceae bacterium]|nr:flagellar biosynthesis regulator FlaF [Caulobacteraceae bacterium]